MLLPIAITIAIAVRYREKIQLCANRSMVYGDWLPSIPPSNR
jgi:hypothetical protein